MVLVLNRRGRRTRTHPSWSEGPSPWGTCPLMRLVVSPASSRKSPALRPRYPGERSKQGMLLSGESGSGSTRFWRRGDHPLAAGGRTPRIARTEGGSYRVTSQPNRMRRRDNQAPVSAVGLPQSTLALRAKEGGGLPILKADVRDRPARSPHRPDPGAPRVLRPPPGETAQSPRRTACPRRRRLGARGAAICTASLLPSCGSARGAFGRPRPASGVGGHGVGRGCPHRAGSADRGWVAPAAAFAARGSRATRRSASQHRRPAPRGYSVIDRRPLL